MCVLELNYDFDGTPLRVPEDRGNDPNLAPFGLTHVVGAEEVEVEGEHQVAQPVHILFYQSGAQRIADCHVVRLWLYHDPDLAPFLNPCEVGVEG